MNLTSGHRCPCDCAFDVSWEHNSNCPNYDGPRTGATPTEVVTDEAADFFAHMTEETVRAMLEKHPPRLLSDIYHGWRNTTSAPDWFAEVAHDVITDIVREATVYHGTLATDHIDKLWAVVDDRIVTLTIERNSAQRKLQELRDIIEETT